jgi:hypothetical protein
MAVKAVEAVGQNRGSPATHASARATRGKDIKTSTSEASQGAEG